MKNLHMVWVEAIEWLHMCQESRMDHKPGQCIQQPQFTVHMHRYEIHLYLIVWLTFTCIVIATANKTAIDHHPKWCFFLMQINYIFQSSHIYLTRNTRTLKLLSLTLRMELVKIYMNACANMQSTSGTG